jgi:hypothetical protein
VAEVFRRFGDAYRQHHGASLSTAQRRVMTAIERCRTAALGGHVEQSDACGHQRTWYNSCRNRHCPKCQSLARVAHRVAISNDRLIGVDDDKVRFRWKDYRNANRQKTMTLGANEFIRRFLLHVLPDGFQRIRYYGFLGNRWREEKLTRCRQLLAMPQPEPLAGDAATDYRDRYEEITGASLTECPACHHGRMLLVELINATKPCPPTRDTSRPLFTLQSLSLCWE